MATINDSGFISAPVGASALAAYVRVRFSSGLLVVGGATDNDCIGVTLAAREANATECPVKLFSAPGTMFFKAGGAIAAAAPLYPAASGAVDDASSGTALGYISKDAVASGDVFEAYPVK
jgi:hypothetical protein